MSSTVPERKRNNGKKEWDLLIRANELTCYTIEICDNKNIFVPEHQSAITDKIIKNAIMIYVACWDANQIRVSPNTPDDERDSRKKSQDKAIKCCNRLLALMQIAKRLFHLKTKRIKYWGKNTIDVREGIKRWQKSDQDRYRG